MVPEPPNTIEVIEGHLQRAQAQENCWLEHAIQLMEKEALDEGDAFAWTAYHASQLEISDEPANSQCLSLFNEKSATVAMIKNGMDVVMRATHFLNPEQIPVIAMDAPLYSLAKLTQ